MCARYVINYQHDIASPLHCMLKRIQCDLLGGLATIAVAFQRARTAELTLSRLLLCTLPNRHFTHKSRSAIAILSAAAHHAQIEKCKAARAQHTEEKTYKAEVWILVVLYCIVLHSKLCVFFAVVTKIMFITIIFSLEQNALYFN
jgi:flagellar biosynthesis protein FliP